jgi:hypothetical protein
MSDNQPGKRESERPSKRALRREHTFRLFSTLPETRSVKSGLLIHLTLMSIAMSPWNTEDRTVSHAPL